MKPLCFGAAVALALPLSAVATVAMEAQQVGRWKEAQQPPSPGTSAHRPLFIVKYELRRPPPGTPRIVMDDAGPRIVPPAKHFPAATLGAMQRDPNTFVCHGWDCRRKP